MMVTWGMMVTTMVHGDGQAKDESTGRWVGRLAGWAASSNLAVVETYVVMAYIVMAYIVMAASSDLAVVEADVLEAAATLDQVSRARPFAVHL